MTREEIDSFDGTNPVKLLDGQYGLLLVCPGSDGLCGVQVSGEDYHRWIPAEKLKDLGGGALMEVE